MKGSPILLNYRGQQLTIQEAADLAGLTRAGLYDRLTADWSITEAIETPRRKGKRAVRHEFRGERLTVAEISAAVGLSIACVWSRLKKGVPVDAAPRSAPTVSGRVIEHDGRSQTISAWAQEAGLTAHTLRARLRRGMPIGCALTTPLRKRPTGIMEERHPFRGQHLTVSEIAAALGVKPSTVLRRIAKGMPLDRPRRWRPAKARPVRAPKAPRPVRVRKERPIAVKSKVVVPKARPAPVVKAPRTAPARKAFPAPAAVKAPASVPALRPRPAPPARKAAPVREPRPEAPQPAPKKKLIRYAGYAGWEN